MMQRKDEAEELLDISKKMLPEQKGREAIEVVLRALEGKKEEIEELMLVIEKEFPQALDEAKKVIDKIYAKSHPQFFEIEISDDKVEAFWKWFAENQEKFIEYYNREQLDLFFQNMQAKLSELLSFLEIVPELAIEQMEDGYQITFADFYMKALESAYEKMIRMCPDEEKTKWKFQIVH